MCRPNFHSLIFEKHFSFQGRLVLSFIDYEQAFYSVDGKALAKVIFLYGIPTKHIKVISAMYENNTAAVRVGNEARSWFCIKSGVKQSCFYPPLYGLLCGIILRSTGKVMGDHRNKWGGKALLDLDYADVLSILDESGSKMNKHLNVIRFQCARIGLKINVKKIKSLRLGISEDETRRWVTKRLIRWTASLILVVLLAKMVGAVKMLKVEQPRLKVFSTVKKSLEE